MPVVARRVGGRLTAMAAALVTLLAACWMNRCEASAPSQPATEYDLQAVYIYNFVKFVRWPLEAGPTIDLCVAGQPAYEESLRKMITNERVEGRTLTVKHIDRSADETGCDVLFLSTSVRDQMDRMLAAVDKKPVLTVSDATDFLDRGGMIQFVPVGNHVRFEVNLKPVMSSHLSLSSELLKVAVHVRSADAGGGR